MKRFLSKLSTSASFFSRRAFIKNLLSTAGGALVVSSFWVVGRATGKSRRRREFYAGSMDKAEIFRNPPDDPLIIEDLESSHFLAG